MDQLNASLAPYFDNPYILGLVTIVLILYGSMAQQTLPKFMYTAFNNPLFEFVIYLSIAFLATQDFRVAFVVALLFAIMHHQFNQSKIHEAFSDSLKEEGFASDYAAYGQE